MTPPGGITVGNGLFLMGRSLRPFFGAFVLQAILMAWANSVANAQLLDRVLGAMVDQVNQDIDAAPSAEERNVQIAAAKCFLRGSEADFESLHEAAISGLAPARPATATERLATDRLLTRTRTTLSYTPPAHAARDLAPPPRSPRLLQTIIGGHPIRVAFPPLVRDTPDGVWPQDDCARSLPIVIPRIGRIAAISALEADGSAATKEYMLVVLYTADEALKNPWRCFTDMTRRAETGYGMFLVGDDTVDFDINGAIKLPLESGTIGFGKLCRASTGEYVSGVRSNIPEVYTCDFDKDGIDEIVLELHESRMGETDYVLVYRKLSARDRYQEAYLGVVLQCTGPWVDTPCGEAGIEVDDDGIRITSAFVATKQSLVRKESTARFRRGVLKAIEESAGVGLVSASPGGEGFYSVQLIVSSSRETAESMRGYWAGLLDVPLRVDYEGGLFKVRAGAYATREEATQLKAKVVRMGVIDAFIARVSQ